MKKNKQVGKFELPFQEQAASFDLFRKALADSKNLKKELCWVLPVDEKGQPLKPLPITRDPVVNPAEVYGHAFRKQATAVVLASAHPGGKIKPTLMDSEITDVLQAVGSFTGIRFLDHLLINTIGYFSFAEASLLDQINRDSYYDLSFNQIKKMKKRMVNLEKNQKLEIAKRMLADDMPLTLIERYTGITAPELGG